MAEELFTTPSNLNIKSVTVDLSGALDGQSLVFDGTKFAAADVVPVGTVEMWVNSTPPSGWLMCYGQAIDKDVYSRLFAVIGTNFGSQGLNLFRVPNFDVVRPFGIAGGSTPGSGVETIANASFAHNHTIGSSFTSNDQSDVGSHYHSAATGGNHTHTLAAANNTHYHGSETASGNHTHQHLYNSSSFNAATTGATGHTSHTGIDGVNAAVGDHAHSLSENATAHTHSLDSATTSHTHSTFDGAGTSTDTATSFHSHTVNTQRIYFIIKY